MNLALKTMKIALAAVCLLAGRLASPASADLMVPALSIRELTDKSDAVFKATALETTSTQDSELIAGSFEGTCSTRFKIISSIKGDAAGEIEFHHLKLTGNVPGAYVLRQCYSFRKGKTYLVWASKVDGFFRQSVTAPALRTQGAYQAVDETPAAGTAETIEEWLWGELTSHFAVTGRGAPTYTFMILGGLSDPRKGPVAFERSRVIRTLAPSFSSPNEETAQAAINVLRESGDAVLAQAILVQTELVAAATAGTPSVRATALRALYGVKTPEVRQAAFANSRNEAPAARGAALGLLADFDGPETRREWALGSRSPDPQVRIDVARAVLRAGDGQMAAVLDPLLDDTEIRVRGAAARTLRELPGAPARAIWLKRRTHREFWPLFINALAAENPASYTADLTRVIRMDRSPDARFLYPDIDPASRAWHLLFEYFRKQPAQAQAAAENALLWDALESKSANVWQIEILYEWYKRAGLDSRAHTLRVVTTAERWARQVNFERTDEALSKGTTWSHRDR